MRQMVVRDVFHRGLFLVHDDRGALDRPIHGARDRASVRLRPRGPSEKGLRGVRATPLPFVSVVMPVRQEASHIAHTVGAVLAQDYPGELLEVIVADGMSTDGTRGVLEGIQREHANLIVLDNPGRIAPTALNVAIRAARGAVIVRVDGHTEVAADYVRECVEALARSGADNAGGRMNALGEGAFGAAVALATSSPFGVGGARFHYSDREEWVDTVYLGAWRRDVFDRIGFFDEELVRNQDDEFNYRLRASGGRILLGAGHPVEIHGEGESRATLEAVFSVRLLEGARAAEAHAADAAAGNSSRPHSSSALLALDVGAPFWSMASKGLVVLAMTYLAVNLAAAIATDEDQSSSSFPRSLWRSAFFISLTGPVFWRGSCALPGSGVEPALRNGGLTGTNQRSEEREA